MSIGRCPRGIRRHYSDDENIVVNSAQMSAAELLGRSERGVREKLSRNAGEKVDTHFKDGGGKYLAQDRTKESAHRNRQAWEDWEDDYLLLNPHVETLKEKALALGRTYRAAESRRRDLMRKIDKT